MNFNIIEGKWEKLKGKIESEWGKLTDDPTTEAKGDLKQFEGYLQEQYGWAEDRAADEFRKFEDMYTRLDDDDVLID